MSAPFTVREQGRVVSPFLPPAPVAKTAPTVSLDLETRSASNLVKVGVYRYAEDPTTEVICACYKFLPDGEVKRWNLLAGEPMPRDLLEHVLDGGVIRAWNAQFERVMWDRCLRRRLPGQVPHVNLGQWIDTAAEGAAMSLPRGLDGAAKALGLPVQKDDGGRRLMLQMSKPRSIAEDGTIIWWEDDARVRRLLDYCAQDVVVEAALAEKLRNLSPSEQALYWLDQRINDRGVYIDAALVEACLDVIELDKKRLNKALRAVTGGAVSAVTKAADLTRWLNDEGVAADSVDKASVRSLLDDPTLPEHVREAVQLRAEGAKSSTAKLVTMKIALAFDGSVKGTLLFHGAGTGRWSGKLLQPQNMPRASVDEFDLVRALIIARDLDSLLLLFGSPTSVVSAVLRPCLQAGPGNVLIAADYSNIEGRVNAWLAGEAWKVKAFADFDAGVGADLYVKTYSASFGVPIEEVSGSQRQVGKVQELALGYQGGVVAFQSMAALYGLSISDEEAERLRDAWRGAHPDICRLWYGLEAAALDCVRTGEVTPAAGGRVKFALKGGFLWLILPSGRAIAYCDPKIRDKATPWGAIKPAIRFMGVDSRTRKWSEQWLYGGLLTENAVQAIARDIMAHAMPGLEAAGYPIVLTVHDEIVCEVPEGFGSLDEMTAILCDLPAWAAGMPVAAAGWRGLRYRKG